MTKKDDVKELEGIVKRHVDNKDYFTAKSYVQTWGANIEGYPVDVKLKEIEELEAKENKKKEE